jgi:uncharacterized protein (DUF302 family)
MNNKPSMMQIVNNIHVTRRSLIQAALPGLVAVAVTDAVFPTNAMAQNAATSKVTNPVVGRDGVPQPTTLPFTGQRAVYQSALTFDAVLEKLHQQLGRKPVDLRRLREESPTSEAFERNLAPYTGAAGFMLFGIQDYGAMLHEAGIDRQELRLMFGNPMIAITMIREDLTAALFVPVEILLTDGPDHGTCTITHIVPSTLMVIDGSNKELAAAAAALDAKLESLLRQVVV